MTPTATHTAWFLFCPVYIADPGDGCMIWARWPILFWRVREIRR